jgi:hypothetical protein
LVEDERTIGNYRSLAELEVVNNDETAGTARRLDLDRKSLVWGEANPRAAERAGTFVFLASIVGTLRPGRGRGASAPEVKAGCSVPDLAFTVTDADTVVDALTNPDTGMSAIEVIPGQGHNKPARYFLSTRLTHRMLVNNIRRTITDAERDKVIAEFAQRLSSTGPFRETRFVPADPERSAWEVLSTAGLDMAHTTRLVVLDPAQFSLRDGSERETLEAVSLAMGLGSGTNQIPVQWASSCVFAVANTQRRSNARGIAVEYLARQKALEAPEIQADDDLKATGSKEFAAAREQLEKAIKRAYQHVAFLAQPDPDGERHLDQITFDDQHSTSLDGTIVWKALAERDKVFDAGAFNSKVLVHNLRDNDYGRTLVDLRAAFYSAPRLPLLFAGDEDLQTAIFDAASSGALRIVDGAGEAVAITAPNEVNLASAGLRLEKSAELPRSGPDTSGGDSEPTQGEDGEGGGDGPPPDAAKEQRISFSLTENLLGNSRGADDLGSVLKTLYQALDERNVSYAQGTLQLVVSAAVAEELSTQLEAVGVKATIKPV